MTALLDEAQDDRPQRRPVERPELLVAHEAVGAFVQRDEDDRVCPGTPGRLRAQSMATGTSRSQAASTLSGVPEHVHDDPPGAAQGVTQDVEGSFGRPAREVGGEARAHQFVDHTEHVLCPVADRASGRRQPAPVLPSSPGSPSRPRGRREGHLDEVEEARRDRRSRRRPPPCGAGRCGACSRRGRRSGGRTPRGASTPSRCTGSSPLWPPRGPARSTSL